MKKVYQNVEIQIILLNNFDVLTVSNDDDYLDDILPPLPPIWIDGLLP
jgi:hypothetical protein